MTLEQATGMKCMGEPAANIALACFDKVSFLLVF